MKSLQAGRLRAKEAAQRVVSYVCSRMKPSPPPLSEITKFVTDALLNPEHAARSARIRKIFKRPVNEEFLLKAIDAGRVKIKL